MADHSCLFLQMILENLATPITLAAAQPYSEQNLLQSLRQVIERNAH